MIYTKWLFENNCDISGCLATLVEFKGTLLGTPNREPQEYSRNILEYKDPGRYIPIIYLLYSWGSLFGVPSRVPLEFRVEGWE